MDAVNLLRNATECARVLMLDVKCASLFMLVRMGHAVQLVPRQRWMLQIRLL